jgi:uncharacterized protein YegP (UPF0339 family)
VADRVVIYRDSAGGWRWRRQAGNNRIIADSGEAYTRRDDASDAARRANPGAVVVFAEQP